MARILLLHWKPAEAGERIAQLKRAGHQVEPIEMKPDTIRRIRENPPTAVMIDLSRLPSHGRDVAMVLRQSKATRQVPLVFVDGEPEKVERVKQSLPDAVFTTWSRAEAALKRAIAKPVKDPVVPASNLAGYSGTPLPKKLGIKPNARVALIGAPDGFEKTLGELPEGAVTSRRAGPPCDLILWFVRSREKLAADIKEMAPRVGAGGMWICWPKKTSPLAGDLTQNDVRQIGLASGLVDYKVCAVDADWSGLKFARRR